MDLLAIGGLLRYLLTVLVMLESSTMAFGQYQGDDDMIVEIVSKQYSSGYLPVVGSYVEYKVRLTNIGSVAVENQSLRVSLVSDGNKTHSSAVYSTGPLEPGESKNLHLGPFKMEDEGKHRLLLLAESEGLALDYPHPDSFIVYQQSTVQVIIFVAVPLVVAGSGIVGFSLYQRARRRPLPTF